MSWQALIESLIPPPDASEKALSRWRSMIAAAIIALIVVTSLNVALGKGWIGPWGYASDVKVEALAEAFREQSRRSLESEILTLRERQCRAIRAVNVDASRFAAESMQKRRSDYHELTDRPYPLPTCREVGVDTGQ